MIKLPALTCVVGLLACGIVIEGCATTGSQPQASTANGALTRTDADYLRVGQQVRIDGDRILR